MNTTSKTSISSSTKDPSHKEVNDSKRHFLRSLTAVMGGTLVAQFANNNALAAAFNYQAKTNSVDSDGVLFSKAQMKILHDICAVVLPRTDTPSAAELDVHGFLDHQLSVCYETDDQQLAISIVNKIEAHSHQEHAKGFTSLSGEQQEDLLVDLEQLSAGFTADDKKQFSFLKSLIVFGFFTTEIGATQALNYQAVPGGFKGSVSYSTLKKAWGSLGFY